MLSIGSLMSLDMFLLIFPTLGLFCGLFSRVMDGMSEVNMEQKKGVARVRVCMRVDTCMYTHTLYASMHGWTCRHVCKWAGLFQK